MRRGPHPGKPTRTALPSRRPSARPLRSWICAKTVLIHLMHELYPTFIGDIGEDRVVGFLRSAGRPLALGDLRCRGCRKTAATFSRTGSSCRNLATRHGEPNDHGTFRIRVAPAPISRIRGIDLLITWLGRLIQATWPRRAVCRCRA